MQLRLAFIGFGTVGQGLAEILRAKGDDLRKRHNFDAQVVAISALTKGGIYHPDGLDIDTTLRTLQETGSLHGYPNTRGLIKGWDSVNTIQNSNADTIVEATWTDLDTGEPGISHIRTAFDTGKHVVTANKGPAALAYQELKTLAESRGLRWGIEGTVMAGTPALSLTRTGLAGCQINGIRGILNGTTNFILTQMESGAAYADALTEAQRLGYAEADPTADVEGHDALGKLLILAAVVMETPLSKEEVACQGITHLTAKDVKHARDEGKRWKLLASIRRVESGLEARVGPQAVPETNPLAIVSGATNAITYATDTLGEVTLVGPGAGRQETGFALLADLLDIHRAQRAAVTV